MTGHIFLTGEKGVGKSTVVSRVLARWDGPKDGFRTCSRREGAGRRIFLTSLDGRTCREVACFSSPLHLEPVCREAFLTLGCELVAGSGQPGGLTVMDELGFLEQDIRPFTRTVLARLARPEPVLGVLRGEENPFLAQVAAQAGVEVLTVTRDNRDALPELVLARLKTFTRGG